MSTHSVDVVKINEVLEHPNADRLEIVTIWGYSCVVPKGVYKPGDLAAYIQPDYCVPLHRPEFSFMQKEGQKKKERRIAVCKLRGVYSAGLLIPAPEGAKEGDNVMEQLEITRWEPPLRQLTKATPAERGPEFFTPKYDLENLQKHHKIIFPHEECILTAKLHGTSARFTFYNNKMYCGSRTMWKIKPGKVLPNGDVVPDNAWWKALEQHPWLEEFCRNNPGVVVYGEIVGKSIQGGNFHYGHKDSEVGFYVFDILENGGWLSNSDFKQDRFFSLKFVPTLYEGPFKLNIVKELAEQTETFNNANHMREGVVIKLATERFNEKIGRVALKYVSNQYLVQK